MTSTFLGDLPRGAHVHPQLHLGNLHIPQSSYMGKCVCRTAQKRRQTGCSLKRPSLPPCSEPSSPESTGRRLPVQLPSLQHQPSPRVMDCFLICMLDVLNTLASLPLWLCRATTNPCAQLLEIMLCFNVGLGIESFSVCPLRDCVFFCFSVCPLRDCVFFCLSRAD
jgi:hypothetical protein